MRDKMEAAGVPPRYWDAKLETIEPKCETERAYKEWMAGWVREWGKIGHASFAMIGGAGLGKTLYACAIIRSLLENKVNPEAIRYVKARKMLREIKSTWDEHSRHAEIRIMREYRKYKLLIVDEIDKIFSRDLELERGLFHEIIDDRWDYGRQTLILGNFRRERDLEMLLGAAAMDRLLAHGGRVLMFEGESQRREKK